MTRRHDRPFPDGTQSTSEGATSTRLIPIPPPPSKRKTAAGAHPDIGWPSLLFAHTCGEPAFSPTYSGGPDEDLREEQRVAGFPLGPEVGWPRFSLDGGARGLLGWNPD